jgi:hypothetical protein
MGRLRTTMAGMAIAAGLASGCSNAPPGAGVTNGSAPDLHSDKPAIRTDGQTRNRTDQGELKGAGGEVGGGEKDSGTGGKGGNSGENAPAKAPAPPGDARKDTVDAVGSAGAQPPASTSPGSAAGATKPSGDIKVGTPKGPQF